MASERSSGPLHKGSACMNCRRRKIKCDGVKPMCGPCSRSSQLFTDCEYSDSGITHTQILQDQISILEARLEQLQQPEEDSSLSLHNPYASTSASVVPARVASRATNRGAISAQQVPAHMHNNLIQSFLQRTSDFGFFMDKVRFEAAAFGSESGRPTSALLDAIYVWGNHIAQGRDADQTLLSRAVQSSSQALSGSHPSKVIHCIQAEVLLAYFFFANGRIMEGRYQTSAAVSLILSSGLHRIRSQNVSPGTSVLQSPKDAIEEGERINAFWTVFILNNCWTTVDGIPSNIPSETRIDTPWPLDISDYTGNPLRRYSNATVETFLMNASEEGTSCLALLAKASVLFEQSALLLRQLKPNLSSSEVATLTNSLTSLDSLISKFGRSMPHIRSAGSANAARQLTVLHTMVHAASIQLHHNFIGRNPSSLSRVIFSTNALGQIVQSMDREQSPLVDPLLGTLWGMTCRSVISEISTSRVGIQPISSSPQDQQMERGLGTSMQNLKRMLTSFAPYCKLMEDQ